MIARLVRSFAQTAANKKKFKPATSFSKRKLAPVLSVDEAFDNLHMLLSGNKKKKLHKLSSEYSGIEEFMRSNEWSLDTELCDQGYFTLKKLVGESQVKIYARLRDLQMEQRMETAMDQNEDETEPDLLMDQVDKDDILRRITDNIDDEKYLTMISLFNVIVNKKGEEKAVVLCCKSVEADCFVDFVCTIPSDIVDDFDKVSREINKYRGPESFILDDNYRIALHEYLKAYSLDQNLFTCIEHLSLGLQERSKLNLVSKLARLK